MPWAAAVAGVLGAAGAIGASSLASDAQSDAAAQAQRLEEQKFQQTRTDLAPYRDAGSNALGYYQDFLGANGAEAAQRARAQFQTSPGYEFEVGQGTKAIEGSAAARGGVLAGGALKALQGYGQNMANRESGSYLDRFLGLANMGQNSAVQTGSFGSQSAGRQGQYLLDSGAARAGGYLAAGEGVNGAINNSLKFYGQMRGQQPPAEPSQDWEPWGL